MWNIYIFVSADCDYYCLFLKWGGVTIDAYKLTKNN